MLDKQMSRSNLVTARSSVRRGSFSRDLGRAVVLGHVVLELLGV